MSVREQLAEYLRDQSRWREQKAHEYPEDIRNTESARALAQAAEYVTALEEPNYLLDLIEVAIGDWPWESGGSPGLEATNRYVDRYGFDRYHQMPVEEFLEGLARCITEDYSALSSLEATGLGGYELSGD